MNEIDELYIHTGKDLLDSGITKFEVINGVWIGEIVIKNNRPHIYCKDTGGHLVNSYSLSNKTILDLKIKPLSYDDRKVEHFIISQSGCSFCKDLGYRHYRVPYRTCMADDNSCEYGSPDIIDGYVFGSTCENCSGCSKDNLYFSIHTYDNRIGFDFRHQIKDLIIEPISEMISINFCPWCGRKLTEELVSFDKCGCEIDIVEGDVLYE